MKKGNDYSAQRNKKRQAAAAAAQGPLKTRCDDVYETSLIFVGAAVDVTAVLLPPKRVSDFAGGHENSNARKP